MPTAKLSKQPEPNQEQNPIQQLNQAGQSVWLDYIDRDLLTSGKLRALVDRGLRGVTSNPSIFEKAIGESDRYDDFIRERLSKKPIEVKALFDEIAIRDIQAAADILRPVYDESQGHDGMVSLELAPYLAYDEGGSLEEAFRLWALTNRPNLMIKVPGTSVGLRVFEQLITAGINVNVTLLFSTAVYEQFANTYIRALKTRMEKKLPVDRIASVASFFVSRIDSKVDPELVRILETPSESSKKNQIDLLMGRTAIANARVAYEIYRKLISSEDWAKLRAAGAGPQRLLWASTSVKNKPYQRGFPDRYRDVLYLEELIGADTVTTVPPATLEAFEDHGIVKQTLSQDRPLGLTRDPKQSPNRSVAQDGPAIESDSVNLLHTLKDLGLNLEEITDQLLTDGIRLFVEPYEKLMRVLEVKRRKWSHIDLNPIRLRLPILMQTEIGKTLQTWKSENRVRRIWNDDPTLWTNRGEEKWMGWLDVIEDQLFHLGDLEAFQEEISVSDFRHAVVLGMGGSSLCAEVFSACFDPADRFPDLHILDSTHPDQIHALEKTLDLKKTLFIVSSKSGTTLEPNLYFEYFFDKVKKQVGDVQAPSHFIAITDSGSELEKTARNRNFRRVFHGIKSIGGRYSALSNFGMVPASLMGLKLEDFLNRALTAAHACSPNVPTEDNAGLLLGAALGTLALQGRDKVTLICSSELWDVSAWFEQLLAESTGKQGKGLIPISEGSVGTPDVYDKDRQFVYLRLDGSRDQELDGKVEALVNAQFPVTQIDLCSCDNLGQEFFRWEFATAVAGSILQINPFDQPDVESAKIETRRITEEFEKTGALPKQEPLIEENGLTIFADPKNAEELARLCKDDRSVKSYLGAHLGRIHPRDYLAILAYIPMSFSVDEPLDEILRTVRDGKKIATCLGYGPRYLHSTGQAYKGGPDSGVFIEITCEPSLDLEIPGHRYSFGVVNAAQAQGDLEVLAARKRRLLRIHLTGDLMAGLQKIKALIEELL